MLAVQIVKMYWEKENRTPKGSIMRRGYYKPAGINENVILDSKDALVFVNWRDYIQTDKVYPATDYYMKHAPWRVTGVTSADKVERERKYLLEQQTLAKNNEGCFYSDLAEVDIPGIEIVKEDDAYRIKWYSFENGYQPVRTGYNEDYNLKGSKNRGKRICCETAFILNKAEAGKVLFNYRCTSYYGQHYEQYCMYFLNTDSLTHNAFVQAEYTYEYDRLADLF